MCSGVCKVTLFPFVSHLLFMNSSPNSSKRVPRVDFAVVLHQVVDDGFVFVMALGLPSLPFAIASCSTASFFGPLVSAIKRYSFDEVRDISKN